MKNNVFQLSHRKKHPFKQVVLATFFYDLLFVSLFFEKGFLQLLLLKGLLVDSFQRKQQQQYTFPPVSICIRKKTRKLEFMRGKFSFLSVDIKFNVTKCKFILKNSILKCWLCFSPFSRRKQRYFSVTISQLLQRQRS